MLNYPHMNPAPSYYVEVLRNKKGLDKSAGSITGCKKH